jgi:hypothetical protein
MTVPSRDKDRYTMRPIRNFTRPRTCASLLRGSVIANARTSAIVTTARLRSAYEAAPGPHRGQQTSSRPGAPAPAGAQVAAETDQIRRSRIRTSVSRYVRLASSRWTSCRTDPSLTMSLAHYGGLDETHCLPARELGRFFHSPSTSVESPTGKGALPPIARRSGRPRLPNASTTTWLIRMLCGFSSTRKNSATYRGM